MWKIFWNEKIRINEGLSGVIIMLIPLGNNIAISSRDGDYRAILLLTTLYLCVLCNLIKLPIVPPTMYLLPYSSRQRKVYVTNIFWGRILLANGFVIISTVIGLVIHIIPTTALFLLIISQFEMNLLLGMADYTFYYKDVSDIQQFVFILMFVGSGLLYIITSATGYGMRIQCVSMVGLILLGHYVFRFYKRYYQRMLTAYSDYEQSSRRRMLAKQKKKW